MQLSYLQSLGIEVPMQERYFDDGVVDDIFSHVHRVTRENGYWEGANHTFLAGNKAHAGMYRFTRGFLTGHAKDIRIFRLAFDDPLLDLEAHAHEEGHVLDVTGNLPVLEYMIRRDLGVNFYFGELVPGYESNLARKKEKHHLHKEGIAQVASIYKLLVEGNDWSSVEEHMKKSRREGMHPLVLARFNAQLR